MGRVEDGFALICIILITGVLPLHAQPPLSENGSENSNWPTMNANEQGTNNVEQNQIGPDNLNQVEQRWVFPIPGSPPLPGVDQTRNGSISPPLMVNGTIYIVTSYLRVFAIDSSDGKVLWSYQAKLNRSDLPLSLLVGHVHGINYYRGNVWISLPDCSVVGLDAKSGQTDYSITRICEKIPGNSGLYRSSGVPPVFYQNLLIWT